MKIGIMGGTFDPIHKAHLRVAEEAHRMLSLDEIIFVPAGAPWMKKGNVGASPQQRLEMVRLAISSNPDFRISTVELDRLGNSYTVDTLVVLKDQMEGIDLYFILGRDALGDLPRWKEPARVLDLCTLVVVPRPGHEEPTRIIGRGGISEERYNRIIFLETSQLDIRGSELRRRVSKGMPIKCMVPEPVEQYIRKNKLYQE